MVCACVREIESKYAFMIAPALAFFLHINVINVQYALHSMKLFSCHYNLQLLTTCLQGHLQQCLEQMSDKTEQERLKKEMLKLEHYEFRNSKDETPLHLAAICGNLK